MRWSFILLITLFSFKTLFGQAANPDSLEKLLKQTKNQKKQLELYAAISKNYGSLSIEKCSIYVDQGIKLAQKTGNKVIESELLQILGDSYSNIGDYNNAGIIYRKILKVKKETSDKIGIALALNNLALNYYDKRLLDSSWMYCDSAIYFSTNFKLKSQLTSAVFLQGLIKRKSDKNDEAIVLVEKAYTLYYELNDNKGKAKTLNTLGILSQEMGKYKDALDYYGKAFQVRKKLKDEKGCAIITYNIGNILLMQGQFNLSMIKFQESLKIFEKLNNKEGIANCYNNLGAIYENLIRPVNFLRNIYYYSNALKYHNLSLTIREEIKNDNEIANSLNNIGNIYSRLLIDSLTYVYGENWDSGLSSNHIAGILSKPLHYYKKALAIKSKLNETHGISMALINIAKLNIRAKKYDVALLSLNKVIKINENSGDQYQLQNAYYEMANIYRNIKNFKDAMLSLDNGTRIAVSTGNKNMLLEFYNSYAKLYKESGQISASYDYYQKYSDLKDSLVNEKTIQLVIDLNTKYETEKKEHQIQILNMDKIIQEGRNRQLLYVIAIVLFILLLIVGATITIFKQSQLRKKINIELAHKNEIITEQKREITDSISYAGLIQNAVMETPESIKNYFADLFILFKPRDIVSGDFYWLYEKNNKVIVAAADCTGHGVPGAFMSMLGMEMLSEVMSELIEMNANSILNTLRLKIMKALHQTGRIGENKDGMDIALYIYDPGTMNIEYAGANNPLIIIRNGEIIEQKADKMPIGIHVRANEPFTNNNISCKKGDMLYVYSDGYADQFGGEENKKFMSGKLKKLFAEIANEPAEKQRQILLEKNATWKGDNFQVDDVLIIGTRI
jgi:serine phosphatase RsbU (regulator of sigma subunit)